jgi:trans-2,3-dihydro-3-hydroxyanthranilate isomerase
MEIAFHLVDVFTARPFAGNQLCVVPEAPTGLDEHLMQVIAQEIAFSETTFVLRAEPGSYRMRIFTPEQELPFAGHPTLGTAFTLASLGKVGTRIVQTTEAGEVPVDVDLERGFATMRQLPATFGPIFEDRDLIARALALEEIALSKELPVQAVSTGLPPTIVPVVDVTALRRAEPDAPLVREAMKRSGGEELYAFAIESPGKVTARFFDGGRIGEDPATGSAAGPLGAYLSEYGVAGMPGELEISQGEQVGRPSTIHVSTVHEAGSWVAQVGGGVRMVGEGTFRL